MIEGPIPKDIRKYETKTLGPFTSRQIVCGTIAAAIAYVIYQGCKNYMSGTSALCLALIPAIPILSFSVFKPYGMTLEKFLKTAFILNVMAPKIRKYKTNNIYRLSTEPFLKISKKEYKKRKKKDRKIAKTNDDYIAYK